MNFIIGPFSKSSATDCSEKRDNPYMGNEADLSCLKSVLINTILAEEKVNGAVTMILRFLLQRLIRFSWDSCIVCRTPQWGKVPFGTVWGLELQGLQPPLDPHTDLHTTDTFWGPSSCDFDQVFIKAPGLLDFAVCACGKGWSREGKPLSPLYGKYYGILRVGAMVLLIRTSRDDTGNTECCTGVKPWHLAF